MTEQCQASNEDGRCIFVQGHGGEHFYPNDNQDHSDDIRIRVLRDNVASLEFKLASQAQALKEAEDQVVLLPFVVAERDSLRQAVKQQHEINENGRAAYNEERRLNSEQRDIIAALRSQLEAAELEIERKGIIVDGVTEQYDAALDTVIALQGQLEAAQTETERLNELATHNTDAYIALESQLETVTNSSLLLTEELRRQITGREEKLGVAMEALKEIPCLWDNPALEACDCVRCAALAKIGGKP